MIDLFLHASFSRLIPQTISESHWKIRGNFRLELRSKLRRKSDHTTPYQLDQQACLVAEMLSANVGVVAVSSSWLW